jgi:hypothetical protein
MATLPELATARRAKLKKFSNDIYDQSAIFDVSQLNEWLLAVQSISSGCGFGNTVATISCPDETAAISNLYASSH